MGLCFHRFFGAGELTVPTVQGFYPAMHLAWGDVDVDSLTNASTLNVHLKRSKMN